MNGQSNINGKQFIVDLLILEKISKDTLAGSIIEIYSGGVRIKTDLSDFDGISFFYLNTNEIENNKISLKIHGLNCELFEKEYKMTDDLKTEIYLEYGKTEYTNRNQMSEMFKKLNIKPEFFECGTID